MPKLILEKRSKTKRVWLSFYNDEAEMVLKQYLPTRNPSDSRLFQINERNLEVALKKAYQKTKIKITPQILREWFACEIGRLGVPDRYVDAFCGRVPRSILARHYTDSSPERLKEIYDKAGLKVLS